MPVRLALNWVRQGVVPPDLYAMPAKLGRLTYYAKTVLDGNDPDPDGRPDEEPEEGADIV